MITQQFQPSRPRVVLGALLACLPAAVWAQTPATTSPAPAAGDTIQLSPFTVTEGADTGYAATSTLAGSRLNTALKDTAATIDVMTAEFLSDVGATNLTDALLWANNVQQDLADTAAIGAAGNDNTFFQVGPSFRIRGIGGTIMRNYFQWRLPMDNYNIDRIEESHGPNSILFGIGSAGGIINLATKQAATGRSFRKAEIAAGSFGGYRGTMDVNQAALGGKLGVRLNAAYDHAGDFHTYGFSNKRRADLAVTYELTTTTRLRAEYEVGDNRENLTSYGLLDGVSTWLAAGRPTFATNVAANPALGVGRYGTATRVTYIANDASLINMAARNFGSTNGAVLLDSSIADRDINGGGPGQLRNTDFNVLSATVEQRLGPGTYLEVSYTHQEQNSRLYRLASGDGDGGALTFDPNLTLATNAPNPFGGRLMLDGSWQRVRRGFTGDYSRVTLAHEHDFGRWGRYRIAGLAEYDYSVATGGADLEVWAGRPFNASPENAANFVYRRNYVTEGDWQSYYHNGPAQTGLIQGLTDPVTGRTLSSTWVPNNSEMNDPTKQTTWLIGGQAYYFKDRLVLGAGLRGDRQDLKLRAVRRDPATNQFVTDWATYDTNTQTSGHTRTFGAVFHVTPKFSLLYNQSDSFSLPAGTLILPDSQPGGNPVGKGKDIGFNVTLFDGRLSARAVYYTTEVTNMTGAHGFGSGTTSPANLTNNVLGALVAQNLITSAEAAARTVRANGVSFDRKSDGYELNLVGNVTRNWRMQANYSYTNSAEENIGPELQAWAAEILPYLKSFPQNITSGNLTIAQVIANFETAMVTQAALEGVDVGGNRKQKVNVFTRYSFASGPLRGAFVGGGYLHQSKTVAGEATPLGPFLYGRSYWQAHALVGYQLPRIGRLDHVRLQLNIANLFDDRAPLVTNLFPDGSVRRALPIAPRTWRLSLSGEF